MSKSSRRQSKRPPASPPSPKTPSYRLHDEPSRVDLTFRTGQYGVGCFMAFFLAGWSVGCGFLLWRVAEDPQRERVLFAVPFLVGWFFAFLVLMQSWFGRERFVLDSDGAQFWNRLIFRYGRTVMPLDELVTFGTAQQSDDTQDYSGSRVLELRTLGKPIRFGSACTDEERSSLMWLLRSRLSELQDVNDKRPRLSQDVKSLVFGRRLGGELLAEGDALRTAEDEPIPPPADTRWRSSSDFDAVTFTLRGRWTTGGVLGLLMLNAFWSGITGFFVYQLFWGPVEERPRGLDWLWQFLFLIPFELVGLAMLLGLLLTMLEPVRCYRWRFTRDEARSKLSWFGLGPRWRYPLTMPDRIEVRRVPYSEVKFPKRLPLGSLWSPKGCPTFTLALVDAMRRDLCQIEGLTLGEACHWADLLLRSHPEWFG